MLPILILCTSLIARNQQPEYLLRPPFHVAGSILLEGAPIPAVDKKLIYISPRGQRHQVFSLRALRGRVRIGSRDEALSFVRLDGCQGLGGAISHNYEIVNRASIDLNYCYGVTSMLEYLRKEVPGRQGISDEKLLKRAGVKEASVTTLGDKYVVTRSVLAGSSEGVWLLDLKETVSSSGEYTREVLKTDSSRAKYWIFFRPI